MYDFDSGDLSLDFANTMDWHKSQNPRENLKTLPDLIRWGVQAGLLTMDEGNQTEQQALEHPVGSNAGYEYALALREAIYRIFSNIYAGTPIPADDLALLNSSVQRANLHLVLSYQDGSFIWEWSPGVSSVDRLIWSVARAAARLLTSPDLSRVRVCEDDRGCGYLFVDQTKNQSRRWCSMESCGNRAKARRHYSRIQSG